MGDWEAININERHCQNFQRHFETQTEFPPALCPQESMPDFNLITYPQQHLSPIPLQAVKLVVCARGQTKKRCQVHELADNPRFCLRRQKSGKENPRDWQHKETKQRFPIHASMPSEVKVQKKAENQPKHPKSTFPEQYRNPTLQFGPAGNQTMASRTFLQGRNEIDSLFVLQK